MHLNSFPVNLREERSKRNVYKELYDLEKDEHQEDKKHKEIYKKTILRLSQEYGIDKDDILEIVQDISLDMDNSNEMERSK